MAIPRIGGCFAPPLTDELLDSYTSVITGMEDSPAKDALLRLLACCKLWWDLPESASTVNRQHASGLGMIVELDESNKKALWDAIPWTHELDAMGGFTDEDGTYRPGLFDALQGEMLKMASHLIWHVKELNLDREPLTKDKL